ncbi:hypothetical protein Cri9333_4026 [Crinalium epipsammum PCC 9333]|uniref:Glucose/Sorbosone dehydrogenase domain-containing protein n=1 Tax=Crinalium epipsammum PCC 9333 TaxID=1173022 RepID=K9W3P5_9CYAN|nr:PQQ-dependent sugar dehydrogenase [Crinalium epipsammum]AFZ14831.1 hypothetical protein Cri9333_4026 [Crinalium epipsammum PCC 9333]
MVACNTTPQAESTSTQDNASAQQPDTSTQAVAQETACTLVRDGFGTPGQVKLRVEEVATGLEVPWGIAFLPNRDMLVTERPGRVRLVRKGKLQPQPKAFSPPPHPTPHTLHHVPGNIYFSCLR